MEPDPPRLNLGCGSDIRPGMTNVDVIDGDGVDHVVDLAGTPWPWGDDSVDRILASHVFEHLPSVQAALEESARVLRPGGELDIRMPIGANAEADPDHQRIWRWRTPEFYTGARPWDPDVGLKLVDRDVELVTTLPGLAGAAHRTALEALLFVHGPGKWCFDTGPVAGEFKVRYRA